MNISASQCSSGCESGWTLYLDQSTYSKNQCQSFGGIVDNDHAGKYEEEEEEDLSMVSDASSGPRHYCEDDEDCSDQNACSFITPESTKKSKKKKNIKEHGKNLEDTASSPVRCFSKKHISSSKNGRSMEHMLDFSQGFSAAHFKGKSAFNKHYGFLQSNFAEKPSEGKHGGF